MQIKIIYVGKTKQSYIREGESLYLKRIKRYCSLSIDWVRDEKINSSRMPEQIKEIEAERLMKSFSKSSYKIALDKDGEMLTTEQLTERITELQKRGIKEIVFIIGGALGLSSHLVDRADMVLSLSKMTFTHQMTRIILLEQLYRSFTIMRGEKYHK